MLSIGGVVIRTLHYVVYADGKQFINGDPDKNFDHISSAEIHACADKTALVDEFALDLRKQHNARFV